LGIDRMDMPFTPMKVWTAIQDAKVNKLASMRQH
jgi:hypothetical protein